jgi:putative ABC transport system permease protein
VWFTEWREAHLGHVSDALLDRKARAAVPFELVDLLGNLDDLLGLAEVADDNRCARRWISGSFAVAGVEHDVATEGDEFLKAASPRPVVENLQPGDTATVRTAGGETQLRIVGVDTNQRDDGRAFYVPLTWLQHTTGWGEATNMLWLSMTDDNHTAIDRSTNTVEDALTGAGYRVAPERLYALKAENKAANDAILNMIIVVGGVVVAIGMLGLVNAITMNVIERTREIGVLRCVGARARDIRRVFAAESVVQACLGWMLGLPLGLLLSWILARLTLIIMKLQIATVFDMTTALVVLLVTVALAGLIVAGPVRRATRINAGDAIRYV